MKRIIVLCDGTRNSPEKSYPAVNRPTNIVRLKRMIKMRDAGNRVQVVNYIRGIGTYSKPENVVGGLGGYGIERHIRQAYEFISDNYDRAAGDQIFLFGFSRGAYTVRSLAGLLHEWGIIPKDKMHQFPKVYEYYKEGKPEDPNKLFEYEKFFQDIHGMTQNEYQAFEQDRASRISALQQQGHREESVRMPNEAVFIDTKSIPVWFLGVWDTVASLGYPDPIFDIVYQTERDYHQVKLPPNVSMACQALAIHELRSQFKPVLWTHCEHYQLVAQVWFPGAHSDVGGGQVNDNLSNLSLKWMLRRAEELGLEFDSRESSKIKSKPYADIDISIDTLGWRKLGAYLREEIGDPSKGVHQYIHRSVYDRLRFSPALKYPWRYQDDLLAADDLSSSRFWGPGVDDDTSLSNTGMYGYSYSNIPSRMQNRQPSLFHRFLRWF